MSLLDFWLFILLGKPSDNLQFLKPLRIALITTIVAFLYILVRRRKELIDKFTSSSHVRNFIYLYCLMLIGIPFAIYSRGAFETVVNGYSLAVVLFIAITVCYNDEKKLSHIMTVLLFANIFLVGISLGSFDGLSSRFEYKNTGYDSNDTVFLLLSLMPGSIYHSRYAEMRIYRYLSSLVTLVDIFLIIQTGSRGGFLGLLTFVGMYGIVLMRRSNVIGKIGLVLTSVVVISFLLYNTGQKRAFDVFSPTTDYNYTNEDGRLAIWRYALEVIAENPVVGVGASCFPEAVARIREQRNLPLKWQTVHNTYLQIASEIGLIGFIFFIMLIIKTYFKINRVKCHDNGNTDGNELAYMATCVNMGFLSSMVCAFFLSHAYSIVFALYFGIGESISDACS